jgi:hypothetical protein
LQVRDLFGTGYHQRITETATTYTYSEFYRDAPMISLDLSLKINNYKQKQNGDNGIDSDEFNSDNGNMEY